MDKLEINKIISSVCKAYWDKGLRYGVRNNDNFEKVYINIKAPWKRQYSISYYEFLGLDKPSIKKVANELILDYFQEKRGAK